MFQRCLVVCCALALFPAAVRSNDRSNKPQPLQPRADATQKVDFRSQIQPILRTTCYSCHGLEKQESGLRLDAKRRALVGGDMGPVIVPGDSAASRLIAIVQGRDEVVSIMPPQGEGTPLSEQQVALLRDWIDQGAEWPADSGDVSRSRHWSFQPLAAAKVPAVRDVQWSRNSVDAFVLARLESQGVAPAIEADRVTLLRRLCLDLLGLPPTPEQVRQFLADTRPDAYDRLVDRLLASPHFGERWARHWLDLARYADSDGYEKDRPRPHAWRYRNWVISSINADQPYDQFSVEQLAGDMLPNATREQQVASGFHRNTLHNTEGGVDREEDRVKKTVDRTNTFGSIWLGMTVGCAQCHSHKYDPLTQQEFYSLYAFFNDIQETEVEAPLPIDYERAAARQAAFEAEHQPLVMELKDYEATRLPAAQAEWEAARQVDPPNGKTAVPTHVSAALATARQDRNAKQLQQIADYYRGIDTELKRLRDRVAAHQKLAPPKVMARAVAERSPARQTRIHLRGDFLNPGRPVERSTPQVLPPLAPRGARADRLDLARWAVSAEHPLTARVAVNRCWQRLFGRPIVKSVDDLGTQGDLPSHPRLLDWLAAEFVRQGWSVKRFVRTVVMSTTYRQSSASRPELRDEDPENELLARQSRRRVEAEVIRDLALSVSGLLDPRIGGPSVRPHQPAEYAGLTYANSAKWQVSDGGDAYRRGLYTFFQRTSPYPMLMTFDSPDSNICCAQRSLSNTPLQALTLWNDPVFFSCAQALARRIQAGCRDQTREIGSARAGTRFAFQLCLARNPTAAEWADLVKLFRSQREKFLDDAAAARGAVGNPAPTAHYELADLAAWVVVGRTLLNLDEFISRE